MTTRTEWAEGFLAYAGYEPSAEKVMALVAHAAKVDTEAANNPLGMTEPAPGSVTFDAAGVQAYPSIAAGYAATLTTFFYGHPELTAVLSDPTGGSAVAYATSASLRTLGATCLAQVEALQAGDPEGLGAVLVGMPPVSALAGPVAGTEVAEPGGSGGVSPGPPDRPRSTLDDLPGPPANYPPMPSPEVTRPGYHP